MPSYTHVTLLTLLCAVSLAAPAKHSSNARQVCLDYDQASQVATNFGNLISNFSDALANASLSPQYTDYSESVNSLIDNCPQGAAAIQLPLLSATYTNRTQFETGQGQQQPINFQQLNFWHTCHTVIIRWQTTNTTDLATARPVNGLIVMETSPAPADNEFPFVIDTVFSEFDSAAWLENLQDAGICTPVSSSSPTASVATTVSSTSSPAVTGTTVVVTNVVSTTVVAYTTTTVSA